MQRIFAKAYAEISQFRAFILPELFQLLAELRTRHRAEILDQTISDPARLAGYRIWIACVNGALQRNQLGEQDFDAGRNKSGQPVRHASAKIGRDCIEAANDDIRSQDHRPFAKRGDRRRAPPDDAVVFQAQFVLGGVRQRRGARSEDRRERAFCGAAHSLCVRADSARIDRKLET